MPGVDKVTGLDLFFPEFAFRPFKVNPVIRDQGCEILPDGLQITTRLDVRCLDLCHEVALLRLDIHRGAIRRRGGDGDDVALAVVNDCEVHGTSPDLVKFMERNVETAPPNRRWSGIQQAGIDDHIHQDQIALNGGHVLDRGLCHR